MDGQVRVIICQLECHPAFYIDRTTFLEESFVPEDPRISLSMLSSIGVPRTVDLLSVTKKKYVKWHKERIRMLFSNPLFAENIPKLIILPEGSVPLEILPFIKEFSEKTDSIVVAGTHSIQDTIDAKNLYRSMGKGSLLGNKHSKLGQVSFI